MVGGAPALRRSGEERAPQLTQDGQPPGVAWTEHLLEAAEQPLHIARVSALDRRRSQLDGHAELNIVQGGACSNAQAGRGIFCINAGGSSFRSRSHPIMGISPTDPSHVYMVYSGGDLESAIAAAARPASTATPSSAAPPTAASPGPPPPRSTPTHKARTSITLG